MNRTTLALAFLLAALLPGLAGADELTAIIQKDLAALGYDPGNLDGEATVPTAIAISKFQAEHDLEVTGEATPQLAGVIKAALKSPAPSAAAAPAPASAPAAQDPNALAAAQQACLQQKMAEAQDAQKKKRGFGSLMRAVSTSAARFGGHEVAGTVASVSADVYAADSVAGDLASAAKDLGLTESDVEACRNPS